MKQVKWDVKKNEEIKFFNPELSYELTGYRPINMHKGLDFDKTPFVEVGVRKNETGRYTDYPIGSKTHRDWWKEQFRRCEEGYEYNGYRVTGDHYFFLNFYILLNIEKITTSGQGRTETTPSFQSKQYEYFHYIEMCETLGKDVISFKARGVGFSEMAVSLAVRPYTTTPNYDAVFVAYSDGLLEPTLSKAWTQLEYLNLETETAMKRIRQKINSNMHKKASKVDRDNNEFGHMSQIRGVIVDNARKLRGRRVDRLLYEESGSNPILTETYVKGQALVEISGKKIGTRFVFGTGGDEGPPLAGLEKMFTNVAAFNGLPYIHSYTRDGRVSSNTGFFVPAHTSMVDFTDDRGVTNEIEAKAYYDTKRKELESMPKELMDYCAEYCYFPEEALSKQGMNNFNQVLLANQYTEIAIHKSTPTPERGRFFDIKNKNGEVVGVKWVKDNNGPIEMIEPPIMDPETGRPRRNLYVAGIDSIDHAIDDSVVGEAGSKFALTIKKRSFGIGGNQYVLKYIERPNDVRTAYATATRALMFYECKANLEDTKIGFRTWLRERKLDFKYLMNRPVLALDPNRKRKQSTLWGTPGSEKMIRHGLELIANYIEDYHDTIYYIDIIEQLQKFSYENKGSFDLVMSMVMTEIADEDMYNLKVHTETESQVWQDVGYWKDASGKMHHGVIPSKESNNIKTNNNFAWAHTTNNHYQN